MGDFTGFTFGGIHSSSLGITRVSGGDRYNEVLYPEINDITAEVPGVDGSYYFGSTYGLGKIDLEIAFDSLTETQIRRIRQVFGTKSQKELIFDERPYKKYIAKIESPIELSYICFDEPKRTTDTQRNGVRRDRENDTEENVEFSETIIVPAEETIAHKIRGIPVGDSLEVVGMEYEIEEDIITFINETEQNIEVTISYTYVATIPAWEKVTPWKYLEGTQRIYKGEGKISFVCYFPFAKSVYKQIPSGQEGSDWAISSGILSNSTYNSNAIDTFQMYTNSSVETSYHRGGSFRIYNCGDLPTGFRLYLPFEGTFNDNGEIRTQSIYYNNLHVAYDWDTGTGETRLYEFICKSDQIKPKYTGQKGILIDTNNNLILGVRNFTPPTPLTAATYETDGTIFNEYLLRGNLFKLPVNERNDYLRSKIRWQGVYYFGEDTTENFDPTDYSFDAYIFYDYLYY